MTPTLFLPARGHVESLWPRDLFELPSLDVLDGVWCEHVVVLENTMRTAVLFQTELSIRIPGIDAVRVVFAPNGSNTAFAFEIEIAPTPEIRVLDIPIALRLDSTAFKPVRRIAANAPDQQDRFELDPESEFVDIVLGIVTLRIDVDGNIGIDARASISLPPTMIGETGVVIEASDIGIYLDSSRPPPGKPAGWRGVHIAQLSLFLPGELAGTVGNLSVTDAYIGNGGFSGTFTDSWRPALDARLFGAAFALASVDLTVTQNVLTASSLRGSMTLPFFDEPLGVEIAVGTDGSVGIALSDEQPEGVTNRSGLVTVTKDNLLELTVESLGFELDGATFTTKLSGRVKPLIVGVDWPGIEIKELTIDSDGNVHLDGGWLDLREKYSLDFHGFQMEITKLGFGKSDDGGKWIGFSGGLKLVDGLSAGASVEGLRITWYDDHRREPRITLDGVGVEFEVPEVLRFKGSVSYRKLEDGSHRFDGDIKVDLLALDLQVDGQLVIGHDPGGHSYLAIYLGVELPAGIPLFSTGLALYGMAGLFALEMEPDKLVLPEHEAEEWYESTDGTAGWFKRETIGVADLAKWAHPPDRQGSLALGAGVTIGTVYDNGFTFAGQMLLAIVFPGPILLIEGKANLLKERAKLRGGEDPIFRALAVLDGRAGTFLIVLDARYKYDADDGRLIDIRGGAEAFFSLRDASLWHLYLGQKDPREQRIRAEILSLFEANAYFMLDANQLATGAWIGFDERWKFGPLKVTLEAWIEGNAVISWKPAYFHGDLWLHGKVELSVFGFGLAVTADANFAADVFDPFHVLAELSVGIELPWPLPDFDADITLEWGPEPVPPPLPLPLQEIAVEHFKVTTSWPLPRAESLLIPNYDPDADGFRDDAASPDDIDVAPPPDLLRVPVVPLDCRPHLTFARAVHDDALIGTSAQPPHPEYERIGDPAKNEGPVKVRYGLRGIALHRWNADANQWIQAARKGSTGDDDVDGVPELYGSWAPVPAEAEGSFSQVKLWLWSKTPFDYTRHGGGAWDEWFTDRNRDYPCVEELADEELCYDFDDLDPRTPLLSPWGHPRDPELVISWLAPSEQTLSILEEPVAGHARALCFPKAVLLPNGQMAANTITIELPQPASEVRIVVVDAQGHTLARAYDAQQQLIAEAIGGTRENPHLSLSGENLTHIVLVGSSHTCLFSICIVVPPNPLEVTRREEMASHLRDELTRWEYEGNVLAPHMTYRLKIVTTVDPRGFEYDDEFNVERVQTEYAYFRTDGPPGLASLSRPLNVTDDDEFESGLDDLTRYVRQTVPVTVPAPGEKPTLPRPVYRAYDVGVEFNEDYVGLMYRLERRDLGLYLYDSNNRPVRDAQGHLIISSNHWDVAGNLTLTISEERWITTVNYSDCVALSQDTVRHDDTLTSTAEGQVLEADTVYEARLVPLLLHERFDGHAPGTTVNGPSGTLGRWMVRDEGANDGPSRWEIREEGAPPSRYILQTSNIWGGARDRRDAVKPGTLLLLADNPALVADHPDQPGNWTDYRLSVMLRTAAPEDDAIGVVFRYQDERYYLRFSLDRQGRYRRLVSVVDGVHSVLAEDDFVYRQDRDYLITIEAIGSLIRIYQDGAMVFEKTIDAFEQGGIGLYCWGNTSARFSDVQVDDFRRAARVAYRFGFTTSQFADFCHHLHSFNDETAPPVAAPEIDLTAATPVSDVAAPPSIDEARAFEGLSSSLLGASARQQPSRVEVTRVTAQGGNTDDEALGYLVRSPEPIDWRRTSMDVSRSDRHFPPATPPGSVKIVEATFGSNAPSDESVTLLLREAVDLTGCRIEYRGLPPPVGEPAGDALLFEDDFDGGDQGVLFREDFGPNALDRYTILDDGTALGPPQWVVRDGSIVQTSNVYGGSVARSVADKPGTMALTGQRSWTNVRITATLQSDDDDAIGLAFRYQDQDNYYRFSMDRQRRYRRLIKKADGVVAVLWEDEVRYNSGQAYRLVVDAIGDRLLGYLDEALLFCVRDRDIGAGCVGLYAWLNDGARFRSLQVESRTIDPVLWQPSFADREDVQIEDADGAVEGPSVWAVEGGALVQSSNIHASANAPLYPGTCALGGSSDWRDVLVSVRLHSDTDGAIGVVFRYQDSANYYRFSMDNANGYRRLVKVMGGTATTLWEDAERYTEQESHELTLGAVGGALNGHLDGVSLFTVQDGELVRGRIGLYCRANTGARFERVVVTDPTRRLGAWTVRDDGTRDGPSVWRSAEGTLVQTSNILDTGAPGYQGTHVVTGDPRWTDYRLTVTLRSDDNDAIGVIVRYVNPDNHIRLALDAQRGYRRLIKRENGVVTTLWEDGGGYAVGEPFILTVDAIGTRLVGYVGTERLFSVVDDTHRAGRVGLYCWGNIGARFERVEVRRPPLEARALLRDRFADNDRRDWTFVSEGTEGGPATWDLFEGALRQTSNVYSPPVDRNTLDKRGTQAIAGDPAWTDVAVSVRVRSVLDNDAIGLLVRYVDENNYYRFSMDSQRGYRRLIKNVGGTFALLWEDDVAYEVGRAYQLTVVAMGSTLRGFIDSIPVFVVEDPDLPAGRIGLYCWGHQDARFSDVRVFPAQQVFDDWALDESFDIPIPGRWAFVEEGDRDAPMQWDTVGGELRQTSNVYGNTDNELERPGTYALAGDPAWTDYRVSVRLRSEDDDAIGVMFRCQDAANYYRVSMDRQRRYRRLTRTVDGVTTRLWEDNVQYSVGREYVLTVDCEHHRLTGYLDGMQLFSVEDGSVAAGRIGLYCWGNTGARFAEVRVALPVWAGYYRFGREPLLPAGTRVRLHAGREAEAPPREPGVARRFLPLLHEPGRLRLPTRGADLRVISARGDIGHARHVLPDDAYTLIEDVRLLRSADGTSLFILPAPGTLFSSGEYRLTMTYRRDNRQLDPWSQVLKRAGSSSEERVSIDIPW